MKSEGIFSAQTLTFLRALKRNNNKIWFEKNRETYLSDLREPCERLVKTLEAPLKKSFPGIEVSKRSILRIYRDTRFSKDKTPYKTYMGFSFRDRTVPEGQGPSLYLGFDSTGFVLGAGIYSFEGLQREHFRQEVTGPNRSASFRKAVASAKKAGFVVHGRELKKMPLGFDAKHPNAEYLLHNGCFVSREVDLLKVFYSPKFPDWLMSTFLPTRAFYEWMRQMAKDCPRDPRAFFHVDETELGSRRLDSLDF